jgi:hypothetical protein
MGSDIQSLAIPAKGYDVSPCHAAGLTSLEILYAFSKSRLFLYVLSLMNPAASGYLPRDTRCVTLSLIGSEGAVIA